MEELKLAYEEMPELKLTALAVLIYTKWNSKKASKPNSFVLKEVLSNYASSLSDEDIGYFYDPRSPKEICVNPGQLVGKISNSKLPYNYDFFKGVEHVLHIFKALDDEDYVKKGLIVSDCLTHEDVEKLMGMVDSRIKVFGIGNCFIGEGMVRVEDAVDLASFLG